MSLTFVLIMVEYDSAYIYIDSASDLRSKITRMDAIIEALEDAALKGAATGHLTEYSLDDGQTKIKTAYRSVNEIFNAINAFSRLRQLYINRSNGRVMRLVDSKNLPGHGLGR